MCGGGGSSQTTTQRMQFPDFIKDAYKDAAEAGKDYAEHFGRNLGIEDTAYGGIDQNVSLANQYMPQQQGLISNLYGGGGLGEGRDYIRNAYGQMQTAYNPYLQSSHLDPMQTPYLKDAIDAARTSAYDDVADRFHKAGRSFSGAESGAFGSAATQAALPMLLGQYNQNVANQRAAAEGLLGGALGSSTGLDAAQQGRLKAMMAAPTQIAGLNIPENMQLSIADRQRQAALDAVRAQTASLGGLSGMGGSTQKVTQQSDPFQALLGGGLGLLGLLL